MRVQRSGLSLTPCCVAVSRALPHMMVFISETFYNWQLSVYFCQIVAVCQVLRLATSSDIIASCHSCNAKRAKMSTLHTLHVEMIASAH